MRERTSAVGALVAGGLSSAPEAEPVSHTNRTCRAGLWAAGDTTPQGHACHVSKPRKRDQHSESSRRSWQTKGKTRLQEPGNPVLCRGWGTGVWVVVAIGTVTCQCRHRPVSLWARTNLLREAECGEGRKSKGKRKKKELHTACRILCRHS
ncbi:hypothetical protein JZ751_014699 [Albula glossodonta]|uniref:Uncharacterized protein n=1 Tax=Albula glossodonta TaxID=121402 RepID=A0A8T2N2D9_9TELE|nr:hypothetical protein JZ751_014699 [Albula glossodonta]